MKRKFVTIMIALSIMSLFAVSGCGSDVSTDVIVSGIEEDVASDVSEPEETVDAVENDDSISQEFKNAYKTAKRYVSTMPISKKGLYDQLTSEYGENFPEDAAQFAIDNIEVDWNHQALLCAEQYSESMHMSKKGLHDQLCSEYGEQFTEEEAQYAVDNLDADYKENALNKAKEYYTEMSMSKAEVYDQLCSEYGEQFTEEEAQYAVDNLE